MRFYNLKTRSHVDVPESAVRKMKSLRKTKNGEQTRHMLWAEHDGQMLWAEHDGQKLYKFVNAETFSSTNVPEQNAK